MQRRNACARQVPSSSVETFLNVQPVPSISPAAALSFGMRRMSRPEKSPRFENTVRMGKAMCGASASNIPRTSGCSRRMKGFFISGMRRPPGCLLLSEQDAMSGSVTASMI